MAERSVAMHKVTLREQGAFFLFFFCIAMVAFATEYKTMIFYDADSPWHLAAGDYIRAHGFIPHSDPWSFTAGDYEWINLSWLYDVLISWVAEKGGLEALLALVLIVSAASAALMATAIFRSGCGFIAAVIASLLLMLCFKSIISVRPQTATMALGALAFFQLELFRSKPAWKRLLPLPFYAVLWVNTHGGFLIMLVLLGAYGLEAIIQRRWKELRMLLIASLACAGALLINPYGVEVFAGAFRTLDSPLRDNYIIEWMPATFANAPMTYVYALLLLLLPKELLFKRPAWLLLGAFGVIQALQALRYMSMIALYASPAVALGVHEALSRVLSRKAYTEKTQEYTRDIGKKGGVMALSFLSASLILMLMMPATRAVLWRQPLLDAHHYPVEEIAFLKANYPQMPVFNAYNYGGLVIYLSEGQVRPMIDGRSDTAYPAHVIRDYLKLERFEQGWEKILTHYNIRVALLPKGAASYPLLEYQGWRKVFSGSQADVLAK